MGSVNRLLNKTLKPFLLYALLIPVLSIPVYYFIVDYIWVNELDKHHLAVKGKVEKEINGLQLSDSTLEQTLAIWNQIDPGSRFAPATAADVRADSAYTVIRFDDYLQDREQFRGLATYIHINGKPYRLLVETNMEETDETVMAIAGVTVLFLGLLLLGFVVLNRRLSRRMWQPFYGSLKRLRNFNLEGGNDVSFEETDIMEFRELNDELSRLIQKNLAVYRQQKEFTENAAHELQTPLAIIKSKLDLMLQDKQLTGAQYEIVEAIQLTLTRAYRINKNLLLLARIENRQFARDETLSLERLAEECLDVLAEHLENKHIRLQKNIAPGIKVTGNRVLLEVLLNNLLLNAIRHNGLYGELHVSLTAEGLEVANTGKAPLREEALFKRFVPASAEIVGTGLGLAIVREVALLYGWRVGYRFENSFHIFSVRF